MGFVEYFGPASSFFFHFSRAYSENIFSALWIHRSLLKDGEAEQKHKDCKGWSPCMIHCKFLNFVYANVSICPLGYLIYKKHTDQIENATKNYPDYIWG